MRLYGGPFYSYIRIMLLVSTGRTGPPGNRQTSSPATISKKYVLTGGGISGVAANPSSHNHCRNQSPKSLQVHQRVYYYPPTMHARVISTGYSGYLPSPARHASPFICKKLK